MKRTAYALLGALAVVGILILAAAVPSQTDFDTTYFRTNALPISLGGNLTNWAKLSTNAASSGITGTVINTGASTADAIPRYTDTTGTNIAPTSVTITGDTNLVVSGQTLAWAGTSSFPGFGFAIDPDVGFFRYGANELGITAGGHMAKITSTAFSLNNTAVFGWKPAGSFTQASDTTLSREAANIIQQGDDVAAPANQTFKFADGVGTDKNGARGTIAGGQSTGTGAGGALILQTSQSSTTGSSANAYTERFHAVPKFVNLTESTATTILTVPVAAANYVGFTATITVFASDGTDHQSKTSVVTVDAVAKTTTISHSVSQVDNGTAASAGTLTCTYDLNDAGSNVLQLRVDAASSLTQTTLRCKIVVTAINSNGTAALTEQ